MSAHAEAASARFKTEASWTLLSPKWSPGDSLFSFPHHKPPPGPVGETWKSSLCRSVVETLNHFQGVSTRPGQPPPLPLPLPPPPRSSAPTPNSLARTSLKGKAGTDTHSHTHTRRSAGDPVMDNTVYSRHLAVGAVKPLKLNTG